MTRPAWVDEGLFPFESRFADVRGHAVHYVDEGSGPPLLMLHGNPTWSFLYREVIERLRDSFRCIALDLPGLGLSTAAPGYGYRPEDHADVVHAFVEQLDLSGLTLVVQDWGGPIGLKVAQRSPQRFDRLVLTNTWAWPVNGDLHFEGFARSMGGPLGRELIRRVNLLVNVIVPVGHRRRRVTAEEMAHYRGALSDRGSGATPARCWSAPSSAPGSFWPTSSAGCRLWPASRRCCCGGTGTSPSATGSGGAGRRRCLG